MLIALCHRLDKLRVVGVVGVAFIAVVINVAPVGGYASSIYSRSTPSNVRGASQRRRP